MKFWIGFVCPLLLAGCLSPQHHGPRDEVDQTGVPSNTDGGLETENADGESGLEGRLLLEFRDDRHIINTERMRALISDTTFDCTDHLAVVEGSDFSNPNTKIEHRALRWQSDADLCAFFDRAYDDWGNELLGEGPQIAVPVYQRATVSVVGYDEGARDPSLWSCLQITPTDSVNLHIIPLDGFDRNELSRYPTISERCQTTTR